MKKIEAYLEKASSISGDLDDSDRITIIPSGYAGYWIIVLEDLAYNVSARYANEAEMHSIGLLHKMEEVGK